MPVVLVVRSGYRTFREYLFAGVAGWADVALLDDSSAEWQQPYLADWAVAPVGDRQELLATARELAGRISIDGVLTWDERSVLPAAEVAEALGIRSIPVAAARACRDKARQRELLAAAGIASASSHLAATIDEATAAAAAIGYPVVVKPRSRAASVGVRAVSGPEELTRAVAGLLPAGSGERGGQAGSTDRDGLAGPGQSGSSDGSDDGYGGFGAGVLVEEQLQGAEISIDSWVLDGEVTPFVVAHKRVGFPPYFVETGHVVAAPLAEPVWRQVKALVTAANLALGVDRCVTHTELMLTSSGPRIVEVNGRLGGDLIPYLGQLTHPGQSAGRIAAQVACGVRPGAQPRATTIAGVHFVYPASDLRFERLVVPAGLRAEPWLAELVELGTPGQEMRVPPAAYLDRAGYAIVVGHDHATVSRRLDQVAAAVTVAGAPW